MLPLILAPLFAGLGALGRALPHLIPGKVEKEQRARREDLLRRQKKDQLGLTDGQLSQLEMMGLSPLQAAERETRQSIGAQYGATGFDPAAQAAAQVAASERMRRARTEVGVAMAQADLNEQQRQQQEIFRLQQAQEPRRLRRAQAIGDLSTDITDIGQQVVGEVSQGQGANIMGRAPKGLDEVGAQYNNQAGNTIQLTKEQEDQWGHLFGGQ